MRQSTPASFVVRNSFCLPCREKELHPGACDHTDSSEFPHFSTSLSFLHWQKVSIPRRRTKPNIPPLILLLNTAISNSTQIARNDQKEKQWPGSPPRGRPGPLGIVIVIGECLCGSWVHHQYYHTRISCQEIHCDDRWTHHLFHSVRKPKQCHVPARGSRSTASTR